MNIVPSITNGVASMFEIRDVELFDPADAELTDVRGSDFA